MAGLDPADMGFLSLKAVDSDAEKDDEEDMAAAMKTDPKKMEKGFAA
jgi:hypothetical protein